MGSEKRETSKMNKTKIASRLLKLAKQLFAEFGDLSDKQLEDYYFDIQSAAEESHGNVSRAMNDLRKVSKQYKIGLETVIDDFKSEVHDGDY